MALTVNFAASQVITAAGEIILTDTSTGTDTDSITKRRVYIQASDGTYLVEDGNDNEYSEWNNYPSSTSVTLNVLTKDRGVKIVVQWLTAGNVVVFDKTLYYGFSLYNELFDYSLSQLLASNPTLANDNKYLEYKGLLRTYIDSGNKAIEVASDTVLAQLCYDAGTELRNNSQYYFNGNS